MPVHPFTSLENTPISFVAISGNGKAVAIIANHIHIVVGVPGDPDSSKILRDFESYGSRKLNCQWEKSASGTWWTENGSTRKKSRDAAILEAIRYVRDQENPLLVWLN